MKFDTLASVLNLPDEELIAAIDDVPSRFRKFLASFYPDAHVRRAYLEGIGVRFADDSSFANVGFTVVPNSMSDVHVYIGKNVSIAPFVTCICQSDANNGMEMNAHIYVREKLTDKGDIHIGDESWIGANATILPGVTIGECAVIGAGCVLTHDAEPYGIYAGVPGRKVGDVRQWDDVSNEKGLACGCE